MDWDFFIKNVDLQEYVLSVGYHYMPKKSTVKWKVFSNDDKDDIIALFKHSSSGNLCYYNFKIPTDRGNIVNFVCNRLDGCVLNNRGKNDYIRAADTLRAYLNISEEQKKVYRSQALSTGKIEVKNKNDKFNPFLFEWKPIKFEDKVEYLENRGIKSDIYRSDIFEDRIYLVKPYWEKPDGDGYFEKQYRVCFPLYFQDLGVDSDFNEQIVGLEIRYPDKKLFSQHSNRESGLWFSGITKNTTTLCVGESPIDCLSHYALSLPAERKKLCYVATMGHPSSLHYDIILDYIRRLGLRSVVLINDNDNAGQRFNFRFICNALKDKLHFCVKNTAQNRFLFELLNSDYTESKLRKLTKEIKSHNLEEKIVYKSAYEEDKLSYKRNIQELEDKLITFDVEKGEVKKFVLSVPDVASSIYVIDNFLLSLKLTDFTLSVDVSSEKDWNEDLVKSQKVDFKNEESKMIKNADSRLHL